MRVKEIMKTEVATCTPTDDVATAIELMKNRKCGFLPVVDTHGAVIGVVTDRDLCLQFAEEDRVPSRMAVTDAMSTHVISCFADENLKVVLATMAAHHVHRLPVLDRTGHLQGVLSIDDILQVARAWTTPTAEEIADALKGITQPPSIRETSPNLM